MLLDGPEFVFRVMGAWNWAVKFLWVVPVAVARRCLLAAGDPARLVMGLREILLWLEMCPQHEAVVAVLRAEQRGSFS